MICGKLHCQICDFVEKGNIFGPSDHERIILILHLIAIRKELFTLLSVRNVKRSM